MGKLQSQHETKRKLLFLSSIIFVVFLSINSTFIGAQSSDSPNEIEAALEVLNSPFVTAVLSTIVVTVIAFFAGKFRGVSQKLQTIPKLESDNVEIKKKIEEVDKKVDKHTKELKEQLEKIEERMDKRFDTAINVQRSIETGMNEKFVNLLISLRNYTSDSNNNTPPINTGKHYRGD